MSEVYFSMTTLSPAPFVSKEGQSTRLSFGLRNFRHVNDRFSYQGGLLYLREVDSCKCTKIFVEHGGFEFELAIPSIRELIDPLKKFQIGSQFG